MKAMFSIWQLWKKHISSLGSHRNENNTTTTTTTTSTSQSKRKGDKRISDPQCHHAVINHSKRHVYSENYSRDDQVRRSSSMTTFLEYKSGKSDWVVYGFL